MKTKGSTHSGLRCSAAAILLALAAGAASRALAQAQYTVTDLGTLEGGLSTGRGINDSGQVVGSATTSSNLMSWHAFLYSDGVMTDLGTLGGSHSGAYGINNSSQAVGYADIAGDAGPFGWGVQHAFLYSGGVMMDLGTLGGGSAIAMGINNSGQVVGYANTPGDAARHAFLYGGGVMTDLGTLGGSSSSALSINDRGQVVGYATASDLTWHAFLYSGGVMTDLGTLGDSLGLALSINNSGQIVGTTAVPVTPPGPPPPPPPRPQVVGHTPMEGGTVPGAFLCSGGAMIDLNTLIPADSGWTVLAATAINDNGQIVGSGANASGEGHALLLTPVIPPSPAEMLQHLLAKVDASVARHQPLDATLRAALASIERGNARAAINQLHAFQNQVRAQVARSDSTLADSLVSAAQDIAKVLAAR